MFFLDGEDSFEHASGSRIVAAEVGDHLAIAIDRNTLCYEIFLDHFSERRTFNVLGVAAHQQSFGIEIRFALKLNYSLRNLIRMPLLVVGMLQKLRRHTFSMNARRHEVMSLVAQHANDFGRQRLVQKFNYGFAISSIAFGNSAILDMFSGAFAQSFYVSEKWFISHSTHSLKYEFRGAAILTDPFNRWLICPEV